MSVLISLTQRNDYMIRWTISSLGTNEHHFIDLRCITQNLMLQDTTSREHNLIYHQIIVPALIQYKVL